jgi:hypothetical protein
MITGCNTNVLYRGRQFHVQTEDSGRANPHIISHVYHGGTIIASEKSSYGDHIDAAELDIKVRAKIELQHKTMLKRLTSGKLDGVIAERLGGSVAAEKPSSPPVGEASAGESTASAAEPSGSITAGAETSGSITAGAETSGSITAGAETSGSITAGAEPSGSITAGAELSGSVTPGAATDPAIDVERPAVDTEPIFDEKSAPGFGNSPDSEKPLDEVILEYLVDKARDRAAGKKQPPSRQQRQKG